jgi:dTDP-4-amino-4,6-dideoxygalactose transaminase
MLRTHCPQVTFQARPGEGVYTIMQLVLPQGMESQGIRIKLASVNIETRSWYLPLLDSHPAFSRCIVDGDLSVSRTLAPRMLGVPFHLELRADDVDRICRALSEACAHRNAA